MCQHCVKHSGGYEVEDTVAVFEEITVQWERIWEIRHVYN